MSEQRSKRTLIIAGVWLCLIGLGAVTWMLVLRPAAEEDASRALLDDTSSVSRYKHTITIAADSFSGYALLRSAAMAGLLRDEAIRVVVKDDGADYGARLKALEKGDTQMAVFTIDSLLTAGAALGSFPATIVMLIDETKGADAMVAYKDQIASVQDLDGADVRIVLTPSSPSEFLARVVLAHFQLPSLPTDWAIEADGAAEVYKMFQAGRGQKRAYVLWEPFVTKALREPSAHVLLDSSKLKGYIVDVLVARREFLAAKPELVTAVVAAYFRAAHLTKEKTDGMVKLVMEDAGNTGAEALPEDQARKLVDSVEWKNTLDNYRHFGLVEGDTSQHLEDMIDNITKVLQKTGALQSDPLLGKPNTLFFGGTLQGLKEKNFHPGKKLDIVPGLGAGEADLEKARKQVALPPLDEAEWNALTQIGSLRAEPIAFSRGGDELTLGSRRDLDELGRRLEAWPRYYLKVVGHARAEGDAEQNLRLAKERASTAALYLVSRGVASQRVRAVGETPTDGGATAQSVAFIVGEPAY